MVCARDDTRSPIQPIGKRSDRFYSRMTAPIPEPQVSGRPYGWNSRLPHISAASSIIQMLAEGSVTIKAVVEGEGIFSAAASYGEPPAEAHPARTDSGNVIVTIP